MSICLCRFRLTDAEEENVFVLQLLSQSNCLFGCSWSPFAYRLFPSFKTQQ